jgi:hypothetical protein
VLEGAVMAPAPVAEVPASGAAQIPTK